MNLIGNIEFDLVKIQEHGRLREDENFEFRKYLKGQNSDKIDNLVHKLNHEISDRIDCAYCGNCCVKLKPCITDKDLYRLSQRLDITPEQIMNNYIETGEGEQYFKNLPCSFLKEKKCTIYNDRPEDCKSFPHLHKKDLTTRLLGAIENYSICPIVFNVFEGLKSKLNYIKYGKDNYSNRNSGRSKQNY